MRNASGQQGKNERQWKIKANMNTGDKLLGKHIWQFVHKNIGVRAGGARGPAAPQIMGNSYFLGSKRKFGQSQLLKTFFY